MSNAAGSVLEENIFEGESKKVDDLLVVALPQNAAKTYCCCNQRFWGQGSDLGAPCPNVKPRLNAVSVSKRRMAFLDITLILFFCHRQ